MSRDETPIPRTPKIGAADRYTHMKAEASNPNCVSVRVRSALTAGNTANRIWRSM
jgi:hypothetical protein